MRWELLILGEDGGVVFSRVFSMLSPVTGVDAAGGDPGRMMDVGVNDPTGSSRSTEVEVTSPLPNRTSMMNGMKACDDSSSSL